MSSRRFTLGRATTCDIPIADDSVSRVHAEILILGSDRMLIRDLGSENGTVLFRQGREFRLGEETIFLTDTLRFGEVTLLAREVFEALSNASESAAPAPAPAAARPAPAQKPSSGGPALVRCDCGAIKPRGQRCPVCGE
jgi:pSer/pThr/pTyr-binding forkhead associated (FHA) protein